MNGVWDRWRGARGWSSIVAAMPGHATAVLSLGSAAVAACALLALAAASLSPLRPPSPAGRRSAARYVGTEVQPVGEIVGRGGDPIDGPVGRPTTPGAGPSPLP